jgi:hypothetical protein
MDDDINVQRGPYPLALQEMIENLELSTRPGWLVTLMDIDRGQGCRGLTVVVHVKAPDSYHPERSIHVNHMFPVPPAAYDARSWRRWLFEQIRLVDLHELMEGFVINGVRPYAPSHGPGNDPYMVREVGTDEDQRTSFLGVLRANPNVHLPLNPPGAAS